MAVYRDPISEMTEITTDQFMQDVLKGLSASPKFLQSKYFYNAEGDELFRQIMRSPEYYLSRSEMEIFSSQTKDIAQTLLKGKTELDVVELGAGDAVKSTHLLRYFSENQIDFIYYPIDISGDVIKLLEKELPLRVSGIKMHGLKGEFLDMMPQLKRLSGRRKVFLFLGSTIGNFNAENTLKFLKQLQREMGSGDLMLIGFDLKKNPKQILAAYNDAAGITKRFNLNLLVRIRDELHASIDPAQFDHYPTYDPLSGECRSYIISLKKQQVKLMDHIISFEKYEPVFTELSKKYSPDETDQLACSAGYKPAAKFLDKHGWFLDAIWEKV